MKCSVYIATSADGYIATSEGGVDWLHTAGKADADMKANPDMGFAKFINSVDCMIMGRKCMQVISSFDIPAEQWPYGDIKIYALSNTLTEPPTNLVDKVEIYAGDIESLVNKLSAQGLKHAYIDGGATITSFINLKLINEMTITRAPLLLGAGIPLFGKLDHSIKLENADSITFPNDFIQVKYDVNYL
ncbi:dihydrofolate reductase family protein [Colwellia psychrerythraea]|uniref:Bifunctional deaminase-reductase domain protein n=1 Tax=Colwellia psychrerythraea TaxID=28229 RepID=A0A099L2B5_COLPS|nr:dihydrofolate reductase family protein [Colwellia psychrerythraea]KGJ96013.1 bifunctional deaminase-reductase domain protein [Colwellia psychrerythraea]